MFTPYDGNRIAKAGAERIDQQPAMAISCSGCSASIPSAASIPITGIDGSGQQGPTQEGIREAILGPDRQQILGGA